MAQILSQHIDILAHCQSGRGLSGQIAAAKLPRLVQLLQNQDPKALGTIEVSLNCEIDPQGVLVFSGQFTFDNAALQCQRCLETYHMSISGQFCLSPTQGEQEAERLMAKEEGYEPYPLNDQAKLDLYQLIEDEVILNLPQEPKHPIENCPGSEYTKAFAHEQAPEPVPESQKPNPFDKLASLKKIKGKN